MLLLKLNTIKNWQINENTIKLAKLDIGDNDSNEYKVEAICNSVVYTKKSVSYLPRF